jgi:hypothetical protein
MFLTSDLGGDLVNALGLYFNHFFMTKSTYAAFSLFLRFLHQLQKL